jgi:hypothetical protein
MGQGTAYGATGGGGGVGIQANASSLDVAGAFGGYLLRQLNDGSTQRYPRLFRLSEFTNDSELTGATNGQDGVSMIGSYTLIGMGGGGGNGSLTLGTPGEKGGNGGIYGGGGGGGGAGTHQTSGVRSGGNGGDGAPGYILLLGR